MALVKDLEAVAIVCPCSLAARILFSDIFLYNSLNTFLVRTNFTI